MHLQPVETVFLCEMSEKVFIAVFPYRAAQKGIVEMNLESAKLQHNIVVTISK